MKEGRNSLLRQLHRLGLDLLMEAKDPFIHKGTLEEVRQTSEKTQKANPTLYLGQMAAHMDCKI